MRTLYALAAALVLALAAPAEAQSYMAGNPCLNSLAPLKSITGATSGTAATQIIALSATQTIYVCSLTVMAVSGTTPTFSLVYGTESNCATGQGTTVAAFSTATAGQVFTFAWPVAVLPAGNALCYLDSGTTPIQNYQLTYVQL